MKRPEKLWFQPLDYYKDELGGMWFRIPEWLVRAYKLNFTTNMFRVMFLISENKTSHIKGLRKFKDKVQYNYYLQNWKKKLRKERKKVREKRMELKKGE
jgi:hypothetical protein